MSKKMNQTFKVTALAAALLAAYGPALAEGPENSVSVGIGHWSNDRPHEGVYDGMRDGKSYGLLDADLSKRNDATGTWLGLKARNLGLENREIWGGWQRQGDVGVSLEYSRIRRDDPYTYNTGLQGIGTSTQTVVNITPGMGSDTKLGTTRDRVTANFFKNLGPGLKFNVTFKDEEKDGTRNWSRGGDPTFAVEPINSTTRQLEATLSYARERLQLSGGYYGTSYTNVNQLVSTAASNGAYLLSLPMDNRSHQLFLNGGYDFTKATRGTFKVSYQRATQNEHLPTADNLGIPVDPRAPASLGGIVDTTVVDLGLTSKPLPKLSIVADWRYRNLADKTPDKQVVFGGTPEFTSPLSYITNTGKLEATYRLPMDYSVTGGLDYKSQLNSIQGVTLLVPMRADINERTARVQLRKSMSETINGSLGYQRARRSGANYVSTGDPLEDAVNPFNIADRDREKWRGTVDWAPTDRVALQFVIEDSQDKYSGKVGPYGLHAGTARLYALDGSFQLSQDWQLSAWYSREETKANEMTQQAATVTKFNDLTETSNSFGLGLRGKLSEKLNVGGDLEQYRSVNQYSQNITGSSLAVLQPTLVPVPDITNRLQRIRLYARYAVQKNADLQFNLIRERWLTDDWTWMFFPAGGVGAAPFAFGTTTDGTTVNAAMKQNSTFVGVKYVFRFK